MKIASLYILLLILSSCFVSQKKYNLLKQEVEDLKSDLKDDDKDGTPNYLDLELNSDSLTQVDNRGRKIEIVKIIDIDGDGILDVNDFCPTIKGSFSANGCPDKDGDGIYDFLDKCPNAAGPDSTNGCPTIRNECGHRARAHEGMSFINKSLKFQEKSNKEIKKMIYDVAKVIRENPNYLLEIRSHTDESGDSLKNNSLCLQRAELIKNLLIKDSVSENRIFIKSFGSSIPKESNKTKKGRLANNRIEFTVNFKED